jgi:hypothetical protein
MRFAEERPDAARTLLIVPRTDPVAARISREIQQGATAGISALLDSYLPGAERWKLQASAEFVKVGLHALAEWWLDNPRHSREDVVDLVMNILWVGFRDLKHGRPKAGKSDE